MALELKQILSIKIMKSQNIFYRVEGVIDEIINSYIRTFYTKQEITAA